MTCICWWWECWFNYRLEAIAGDAGLQEKSQGDLERLGNMLHEGCVRAIEEYEAKQKEDPNFDGKQY